MNNVLIIDDTKNIRKLLTTCLEIRGYNVLTAESGNIALNILKKERNNINLIFLDIRMPELNGTEVLKYIKNMGITAPIIIMTAFATVKNAIDCTKLGAAAYLQKPFSVERINSVLDEVISKSSEITNEKDLIQSAKKSIEENDLNEAHEMLKKALSVNPYDGEIYSLLGEVNKHMGNLKEAERFYFISKLFID